MFLEIDEFISKSLRLLALKFDLLDDFITVLVLAVYPFSHGRGPSLRLALGGQAGRVVGLVPGPLLLAHLLVHL